MTLDQRRLLVVAIGVSLAVVAGSLNAWLDGRLVGDGGWFNYAPNNGVTFDPAPAGTAFRRLVVWLAAIGVWTLAGWRLLAKRPA